jgi:amino acid adenylation domain-containing protein
MLSDEESVELIRAANTNFEVYPDFLPIHAYIESQARRDPGAVAIEAGGETIRYGELNARANRLARRLMDAGAASESLVGICVERSIDLVVALLATLKAGAAFVPLDPGFPVERIRNICEDAGSRLVITQERHRAMLAELSASLIFVESAGSGESTANPDAPVSPDNIAYAYYTSGSTGRPKGVIIDHACAMNRLEWLRRRYPLGAGDRLLHKTPLIFDVAIWEIFGPLMAGATILMADPGAESDVAHIGKLLSAERTVFAHFVPSMLDAYLNYADQASYPDLRWVQLSGEAVPRRLFERFGEHFSSEFHNCYGQTETSEVAAWEGGQLEATTGVPIGKQIGVYRLLVLDECLNPAPPGVPGELCVAGVGGLARGYHSRPDLTAEKFVPNPYAITPGERLYRTGDLARLSEDGLIEHLGRIDHQTKIRGCRVEIAEVEAVLASHPSLRACAVIARPDETGANQLMAYLVSDRPSAAEIGAHAERLLPKYMLPAAYIFVEKLPLTSSGKLDRLRLPAPKASDFEARVCDQAPQTPLEMELAAIWRRILGLDRVGRADNFFIIGGNSLRSIQVLVRAKETFGIEVSVRDFFSSPTIEGLASFIERALVGMVASLSDAEAKARLEELTA